MYVKHSKQAQKAIVDEYMADEDVTLMSLARKYRCNPRTIRLWLYKFGHEPRPDPRRRGRPLKAGAPAKSYASKKFDPTNFNTRFYRDRAYSGKALVTTTTTWVPASEPRQESWPVMEPSSIRQPSKQELMQGRAGGYRPVLVGPGQ